jgi:Tol biopolymer transport system component
MKDKLLTILSALILLLTACRKNHNTNVGCIIPAIVPFQPFSDPVWHPKGQLLGFNHTPLVSISANGTAPCTWYYYAGNRDSTGFYLMNKAGTGFRRVTDFTLSAPAWSPDGKWIAFSLGPNIYKMPFDGNTFDTTQIVQLTTNGGNFFPSWTANSDTVYYDSNNDSPEGTSFYSIWKMDSNGSGKTGISNTGRQPFVGSDNRVYYVGLQSEIYSISKDGSDQLQITV